MMGKERSPLVHDGGKTRGVTPKDGESLAGLVEYYVGAPSG
jgi:hypothetical protein